MPEHVQKELMNYSGLSSIATKLSLRKQHPLESKEGCYSKAEQ